MTPAGLEIKARLGFESGLFLFVLRFIFVCLMMIFAIRFFKANGPQSRVKSALIPFLIHK